MILCIPLFPLEYLRDAHLDLVSEQLESGSDFLLWLCLLLDYFLFDLLFHRILVRLSTTSDLAESALDFAKNVLGLILDVNEVLFSVKEELLHGTLLQILRVFLVRLALNLSIFPTDPIFPSHEYPIFYVILDDGTRLFIGPGALHPRCLLPSEHLNLVTVVLCCICHVLLSDVHFCED